MALAKKTKGRVKKRWFSIIAPRLFNNQVIGETFIVDPSVIVGRTVPVNLMNLTRNMKNQNINVKFEIKSITGEKALTEIVGYEMSPSSIKRMVRRGKDKLDQSFVVETAEGKKIRFKTLIIARGNTKQSVTSALVKNNEEILKRTAKKLNYENLVQELITHKLQSNIKRQLSKIYPLKTWEIRVMVIEKEKRHFEEEKPGTQTKSDSSPEEKPKKKTEKPAKEEKPKEEKKPAEEKKEESKKEEKPAEEKPAEEKKEEKPKEEKKAE